MTRQVRWNTTPTLFTLLLLIGACAPGSVSINGPGGDGDAGTGGGTGSDSCEGPLGKPMDPTTLTPCCEANMGAAHCVDGGKVPSMFQQYVETCPGTAGFCVPDKFIATGGVYTPPPCTSLAGNAGVCLSVCIPQVAQYIGILPQDVCDADERCAPCISPLDMTNTHACEIAGQCIGDMPPPPPPPPPGGGACEHSGPPVIDPTTLPSCGADAHCLSKTLVPMDFASKLAVCPTDATAYCVPDVAISSGGKFTPATCTSIVGAEGRCLSTVLPDVQAQLALLPQDTCTAAERCVPCYSPMDGSDTGACRVSCDMGPTQPAKTLPSCCDGRAKCVPNAAVPDAEKSNLGQDSCEDITPDAFLCVPNELIDPGYVPPTCSATSFLIGDYTGVCLSTCLDFGIKGIALAKGDCADNTICAPCNDPLTGAPTGAPGCTP